MNNFEVRLRKLESHTRPPQVLWVDLGMSDADIEAEVERRRTTGILDDLDQLILVGWKQ